MCDPGSGTWPFWRRGDNSRRAPVRYRNWWLFGRVDQHVDGPSRDGAAVHDDCGCDYPPPRLSSSPSPATSSLIADRWPPGEQGELEHRPARAAARILPRAWIRLVLAARPSLHPGAISPAVTQANIQSTICSYGYTDSVRPPESVSEPEKEASLAAYGDAGPLHDYEYDHLVPLELGGAANDPRNLWPEKRGASPNPKDELEDRLNEMVCAGQIPLATAQREIARDWVAAYRRLIG